MQKPTTTQPTLKVLAIAVAIFIGLIFFLILIATFINSRNRAGDFEFRTFANCYELEQRLGNKYYYPEYPPTPVTDGNTAGEGRDDSESPDYSVTNVQVAGIDELDVLKTDGEYMYSVKGTQVLIVEVSNPAKMKTVATIDEFVDSPVGVFLKDDTLVVMTSGSTYAARPFFGEVDFYYGSNSGVTSLYIFDVTDKAEPNLERTISFDGNYQSARLIEDNVYVVSNYYSSYYTSVDGSIEDYLPRFANVEKDQLTEEDFDLMSECNQISYFGDQGTVFTTIVAFDINDGTNAKAEVVLGNTENLYMSHQALYLTSTKYQNDDIPTPPPCDPFYQSLGLCGNDVAVSSPSYGYTEPTTEILKLKFEDLDVAFAGVGTVEGRLLNQFSMDENSSFFRVATTRDTERLGTVNNLFILNDSMQEVGAVEGLARGEKIYSVRFIDERAYVVTFKQVDPLFVIDLSDPTKPEVLGELKIPGYSDYLHPYDENHLLGFGKDVDSTSGGLVPEGLKVALFNVEDPANPIEVDNIILGGRGSGSELLYDHKALLFDRDKDLLVIPVTLRSDDGFKYEEQADFSGFVALSVDTQDGIEEKARLSDDSGDRNYTFFYRDLRRSFYIEDSLYTLSTGVVRSYGLDNFKKVSELEL